MTDATKTAALNATRRQFAAMGAAAFASVGLGTRASAASMPVTERAVGGSAASLFVAESGEHPGLVMFAVPSASRAANAAVAKDLVRQGWSVLLVDKPEGDDRRINRTAKAHTALLASQPGVASAEAGYSLCSFAAAKPVFGLAKTRAETTGTLLVAIPVATRKDRVRRESLENAARLLHRYAA